MSNKFIILAFPILATAVAFAQATPTTPITPETPQTQVTPVTPETPETPKVRPVRPPKPPRPPRMEWAKGSYLGVDTRDVTPERQSALNLKDDKGVEILMVDSDAPAGKAGLKEHDVILSFNGKTVEDVDQLRRMIRETEPGTKVALGINRSGKQMTVNAELASRKTMWSSENRYITIPKIEIPPMPEIPDVPVVVMQYSRRSGLSVEPLTRQLGDFFGAKDGKGVLVRSVEKNSLAETAGFRAGDVIVKVGNNLIENMSDWNQTMRAQQGGKLPVTVIREKREQTFTLAMPERRSDRSGNSGNSFGDFDDVRIEIADLGPEIQRELEQARLEWQKAFDSKQFKEEMKQLQKELSKNGEEMQKQMKEAQKEMQKAMQELQKQKITIHIEDENEE
jgi:membrane-associated protease RseP (regulator of RpoE activity)